METNEDFKVINNYTEQIDEDAEVVNTCQDCTFSTYNQFCKTNEMYCTQGDIVISVNGICKRFVSVL